MDYLAKVTTRPNSIAKPPEMMPIEVSAEGITIKIPTAKINVDGRLVDVDPRELIRIVKYITQSIGEYKRQGNLYAGYAVPALRKARSPVVADLERHFGITWRINTQSGVSEFYKVRQ